MSNNAKALVVLAILVIIIVVDMAAIQMLGQKTSGPFTAIGQPIFPVEPKSPPASPILHAGFAETDITPTLEGKTVYMAGFGQNRKATAIHDPLKARAVVLRTASRKCHRVDRRVGFFSPTRKASAGCSGFTYVLVSSPNHEGPDTLGIWGASPFSSGLDADYMKQVEAQIVAAAKAADAAAKPATAKIGTAAAPELIRDAREPYVKHDELVAVQFQSDQQKPAGILLQWNCHPLLDSKNTVSARVGYTVEHVRKKFGCPVVYLTGTVGGLMTSLGVEIKNDKGELLKDGTFEKTEEFGIRVGKLTEKALEGAQPLALTPLEVRVREVFVPMTNHLYKVARQLGVLTRPAYIWTGDSTKAEPLPADEVKTEPCVRTEIAWLRLGDLQVACIPGEIYPELVLDKVQDPADPAADFPDAPIEPAIYKQLTGKHRMLVGWQMTRSATSFRSVSGT